MVGQPKHLSDLAKIEADVRITCRRCSFEQDWTIADLAAHLHAIGGSTVWSQITRHLRCGRHGCGSGDLRALPVPYARRQANVPRQIGKLDERLIAGALAILENTAAQGGGTALDTPAVRLALLVLHRYARDSEAVRLFWARAGDPHRAAHESLRDPLAVIRFRLEQRGWIAPKVLLARVPSWPWDSPAPPGWYSQSGHQATDGEGG